MPRISEKLGFLTALVVVVRLKSDDKLVDWYFCDYFG